jgi:hypothetical protein
MRSTSRLAFWALALFLVALPLTLAKPGLPPNLKADEAAYYLMASSLAFDLDLRLDIADTERAFAEFPYQPINNLIVMTTDGWQTVYYGKPMVYALFAAPFVALFGANGMVCLNMLLLVGMISLGARYLRRWNDDGVALLFSAGFFLASAGFAYVFWLQPEVFSMFAVTAALYLGWPRERSDERSLDTTNGARGSLLRLAAAGAALALAIFNKPMVLALALPIVVAWLRPDFGPTRRVRIHHAGAFVVGIAAALLGIFGINSALTGKPTPYLGVARQGVTLCEPGQLPPSVLPAPLPVAAGTIPADPTGEGPDHDAGIVASDIANAATDAAARTGSPIGNAFSWLLRVPEVEPEKLFENVGYFLWGRHTGLLLYFPFCAIAVVLFLLHARGSLVRWLVLVALTSVAGFFLLQISWNWQGGGGFVGNRYFVNAVPAFLFLVTRISPRFLVGTGYAAAGVLIGPLLLSPFGNLVPESTLQAHTRNWPLRLFPLELSLRNVPGYFALPSGELRLVARRDRTVPQGDALWLSGGTTTEVLLIAREPLTDLELLVSSPSGGRVVVAIDGDREALELRAGEVKRLRLEPGRPKHRRSPANEAWWVYRMTVEAPRGALRKWLRGVPPPTCDAFNADDAIAETFYTGAELVFLGSSAALGRDLYRANWGQIEVPTTVVAGSVFDLQTPVRNRSATRWPARGGASVKLSYRWLDASGNQDGDRSARTALPRAVEPGEGLGVTQEITAPAEPGSYTLELDLVYEHVAWFGERDARNLMRAPVEVTAALPLLGE